MCVRGVPAALPVSPPPSQIRPCGALLDRMRAQPPSCLTISHSRLSQPELTPPRLAPLLLYRVHVPASPPIVELTGRLSFMAWYWAVLALLGVPPGVADGR